MSDLILLSPFPAGGGGGSTLPVSDDYNRPNDAAAVGTSTSGHLWTTRFGTMGILSNRAYLVALATGRAGATVDAGTGDCTLEVKLPTMLSSAQQTGFLFRWQDALNFHAMYYNWNADNLEYYRMAGGVFSAIALVALPAPPAADNTNLKLVMSGTSLQLYHAGVLKMSQTSAHTQAATHHGLYGQTTNSRWDDFSIVA